ncbi:MAG: methyltransferase domain-containing protein [Bdellovibrionales bacterium]|nr:methyltransferase [Bdellovibrionales bacterium]NQZ18654.1 methyltransferase domain-containing protein [Bdellovibrionales bacterium]
MAAEKPKAQVMLFDSSKEALEIARKNKESLKLENVELFHGSVGVDAFSEVDNKVQVDFVLANPPYIEEGDDRVSESVHNFEPHEALYARNNGLEWIHLWLQWSYDYLIKGGHLMMEFGLSQEDSVKKISEEQGYQFIKFINDYSGKIRFILLSK